jgi:ammonia channel protein AmtB
MFVVLGLIPGWIIAKILHAAGKLRIPREVEIAGLDYNLLESARNDEKAVSSATR